MSATPTICPACEGKFARRSEDRPVKMAGRTVTVTHDLSICTNCGFAVQSIEDANAVLIRAADHIRTSENLLTPAEIKDLRESLGLSHARFEKLMRVGPKTVHRWERGTVFQSKIADEFMRTIRDVPGVAEHLARKNGVRLKRWESVTLLPSRLFDYTTDFSLRSQGEDSPHIDEALKEIDLLKRMKKAQKISAGNTSLALAG